MLLQRRGPCSPIKIRVRVVLLSPTVPMLFVQSSRRAFDRLQLSSRSSAATLQSQGTDPSSAGGVHAAASVCQGNRACMHARWASNAIALPFPHRSSTCPAARIAGVGARRKTGPQNVSPFVAFLERGKILGFAGKFWVQQPLPSSSQPFAARGAANGSERERRGRFTGKI